MMLEYSSERKKKNKLTSRVCEIFSKSTHSGTALGSEDWGAVMKILTEIVRNSLMSYSVLLDINRIFNDPEGVPAPLSRPLYPFQPTENAIKLNDNVTSSTWLDVSWSIA